MIYIDHPIPKKIDQVKLNDAIDWIEKRLPIEIDVFIEFDVFNGGYTGDAGWEDSDMYITMSRRIGTNTAIKTVFHELVHVQQFLDSRLTYCDSDRRYLWDGAPFHGNYFDSPWEKEAFSMETILIEEYKNYVQTSQDVL